ncbi:AAA family ATPase [Acidithrix sp. C25]|uniref:AAA family ATPase n=1 Tax=Acidithrix sp. C25 TaxID=1671482 RepID=UPI00191BA8F8|nr:AAA family ATPase [Acidithrix sp. C25]
MIRRLDWIKDSGIFVDYRWATTLPDFAKINVIYGPNGSGKTSLARAVDGTRNVTDGYQNLSLKVEELGSRRDTNGNDDQVFDRLHVFCETYIERSLRFHEGSPNIDAVLTLGERTAEAEARIERLQEELVARTNDRDTGRAEALAAERAATASYERVSASVVGHLSRVQGFRSRASYNSGVVGRKYVGDRTAWKTLTDVEIAEKTRFVASDNREEVERNSFSLNPAAELKSRAESLLAKTPVAIVLDTLTAHPEATSWVQDGLALHEHLKTCLFCGQPLPTDRLHDIEQHFSDEVSRMQRELDGLSGEFESLVVNCDALVQQIPTRGLLFEDLRSDFDEAAQGLRDQVDALKRWADEILQRMKKKRTNVLNIVEGTLVNAPAIDGSAMDMVCRKHNNRVTQHDQLLTSTANEIEGHHLKAEEKEIDNQAVNLTTAKAKVSGAQARIDEIETEIAALQNVEGDPTPSADVLTREVARLLGRSELSFQSRDGRYVVTRDGQPAIGLSVGERSAIALVHFLEGVACHDLSKGKPIVVIDDPVSSLDSNVFMGISTYIWTATLNDEVEQLVLLTHNFDLFKQWDVQLEGLHRGAGMKARFPVSMYELKSRHITSNGLTRRQPVLIQWPESDAVRKKIRSSYHHAFISVVDAKKRLDTSDSLENRLDAQLLFPNVIRRILESFLAFKRPDWVGDFTASMRNATKLLIDSGYKGDADALRQQLTRYAHAYSHSQTPETDETVNPDEINGAISSVFVFMNQLDHEHFVGLCKVVGVDPESLLPTPEVEEVELSIEETEVQK